MVIYLSRSGMDPWEELVNPGWDRTTSPRTFTSPILKPRHQAQYVNFSPKRMAWYMTNTITIPKGPSRFHLGMSTCRIMPRGWKHSRRWAIPRLKIVLLVALLAWKPTPGVMPRLRPWAPEAESPLCTQLPAFERVGPSSIAKPGTAPAIDYGMLSQPVDLELHPRHRVWMENIVGTDPIESLLKKKKRL